MTKKYDAIGELNASKDAWKIRVRVLRLWKVPQYQNKNQIKEIGMVFIDDKDSTIQASIRTTPALIKFKDDYIKEGRCYAIEKFNVALNGGDYRATKHEYSIAFDYHTRVVLVNDDASIKNVFYQFRPFVEIMSAMKDEDCFLFDVIGNVTGAGDVIGTSSKGRVNKRIKVQLEDKDKYSIGCTLWGEYAEQLSAFLATERRPIVMILQYARINRYGEIVSINNSMHSSKLLLNPRVPEAIEIKNCLEKGSSVIDHLPTKSRSSVATDWVHESCIKTLEDLQEINEECECIVVATVDHVEADKNWFYTACDKCGKKAELAGTTFCCKSCMHFVTYVKPCFRVQIRVVDDTSSASFVLFNREAYQLIGQTASDLRAQVTKDPNECYCPTAIAALKGKKLIFKVRAKGNNFMSHNKTYAVVNVSDDLKLIPSVASSLDEMQESVGDVGERDPKTPTSDKAKRIIDLEGTKENIILEGESSTNKLPIKKIKIEKDE